MQVRLPVLDFSGLLPVRPPRNRQPFCWIKAITLELVRYDADCEMYHLFETYCTGPADQTWMSGRIPIESFPQLSFGRILPRASPFEFGGW